MYKRFTKLNRWFFCREDHLMIRNKYAKIKWECITLFSYELMNKNVVSLISKLIFGYIIFIKYKKDWYVLKLGTDVDVIWLKSKLDESNWMNLIMVAIVNASQMIRPVLHKFCCFFFISIVNSYLIRFLRLQYNHGHKKGIK